VISNFGSVPVIADGLAPVRHKAYAGNRTDDKTHIEMLDHTVRDNSHRTSTPGERIYRH